MKNFIPVMRSNRLLEMKYYLDKGYIIQDKKHYIMLETVSIEYMREKYHLGVQVTQDEFYFFIKKNNANIYLSIYEIYELIYEINKKDNGYFVDRLRKQLNQKQSIRSEFICRELIYKIASPVDISLEIKVNVPQSGIQISNKELLLLILFIQEKSSSLFRRSTGIKKKFVNGILRLYLILFNDIKDDELLTSLGWKWDEQTKKYFFHRNEEGKGREKYKYYLTGAEYNDKLKNKKS